MGGPAFYIRAAFIEAFRLIFVSAFVPQSIAGGIIGVTVQKAVRFGVALACPPTKPAWVPRLTLTPRSR